MGVLSMIRHMDTKRMRQTAREVAKEARRPYPLIFCDMVWCGFKYQAGYLDYSLFQFWDLNAAQRASVLTRGKNNAYVRALNDKAHWDDFDVKPTFLRLFAPYADRKWLDLTDATAQDLQNFGEELGSFLVKPRDGTHGDGVEIVRAAEVSDWSALYDSLTQKGQTLCEEVIVQHPEMSRLWPGSVNTIRLVTILGQDDTVHTVAAYLRVGNGPRPVDNFNSGGMVTPLDPKTGVILAPARDKSGFLSEVHPVTGVKFEGFQVPMWDEVLAYIQKAALVVPQVRYVAWDVAVTAQGPTLVEGNQYPGHDIYNLPGQNPSKMGILPVLDAVVPYSSL